LDKDKIEGALFFIEHMLVEMKDIKKRAPTKKEVIDNLDQWMNTIETIKGIIKY